MSEGDLDTSWLITASSLVLVAHVGLSLIVHGFTRHRSVSTMSSRVLVASSAALIAFLLVGFGLGFGPGGTWIGSEWFGLSGLELTESPMDGAPTHGAVALWNAALAMFVAGVAAAAVAERATTAAHVAFGAVIGGCVYPVAARAVWREGIVTDLSVGSRTFVDSAGSATIGLVAGWTALVGSMLIGPRLGRFGATGHARVIPGRSMPLAVTGALLVLVGWIGIVSGTTSDSIAEAPELAIGALLGAGSGSLAAASVSRFRTGAVGSASTVRGLLAGLVAVSAGVGVLAPLELIIVGALGGVFAALAGAFVEKRQVDDPVGVFGAFGAAGTWGLLSVGVFEASFDQLIVQIVGSLLVAAWVITVTGALFGGLRFVGVLRVSDDEEIVGLDVVEQRRSSE